MSITYVEDVVTDNPLDTLELLATAHNWTCARADEHELDFVIRGTWSDYALTLTWREDLEVLHLAAEIDIRLPTGKRSSFVDLLAMINEQMYLGHFDLWSDEGIVLFRHGLMLQGGAQATPSQCEELVTIALAACDRFYPAFQYLIWAGQDAQQALQSALFETEGHA